MKPRNPTQPLYGPSSFIAAVVTLAAVQTVTWVWTPFWIASIFAFFGASAAVLMVGTLLSLSDDELGQIGRGMIIGWSATPLTAALVIVPPVVYTTFIRG